MAFATQISAGKKNFWFNSAMAFPPLNPSEPTSKHSTRNANKRLRKLPLQYRGTPMERQRAQEKSKSTISNSDFIAADKKQYFSFYRDPKLN